MTHEEIDRKYGPNGEDLDRDVLLHMHRTAQKFVEGNIVHVIGFTSRTSTGEVVFAPEAQPMVATDAGECCRTYTVHFDDGETAEFIEEDLRLAAPDELYCYLHGRDKQPVQEILSMQPPQPFSSVRKDYRLGQAVLTEDGFGVIVMRNTEDDVYYVNIEDDWVGYHPFELRLCNKDEIKTHGKAAGWHAKEINAAIHLIMQ